MAGRSIAMHKYKQLILLFQRSAPIKRAARQVAISRNTVRRYYRQLASYHGSLDDLRARDEPELHAWFNPPPIPDVDQRRYEDLVRLAPELLREARLKGVTKHLLWEEYRQSHPEGYGYSQFCYWLGELGQAQRVTMIQDIAPGEALYVDFAGTTMEVVDPETGSVSTRQIFLATMGYSYLTYAEAVATQAVGDFIGSLDRALQFFGGVPRVIVCDNLKSGVVRTDRYEPTINQALADLAAHYGTEVMPTRVARPQDKARVEQSVKLFYQRVLAPLRKSTFFSDHDLKAAITEQMRRHNDRPMQHLEHSRRQRFDLHERSALRAVPGERFELAFRCRLKAQKNNHVWLGKDKTYYSVPYTVIGRTVEVIYTATLVKIYADGMRVAVHRRTYVPNSHCTNKEHMPAAHQAMLSRHTQAYLAWAEKTGCTAISAVVQRLLLSRQYPELAYRSCDGIRSLYRLYGPEAVTRACEAALELDSCSYSFLRGYLKMHCSEVEPAPSQRHAAQLSMPVHTNIRGSEYYT
jgi:transposase